MTILDTIRGRRTTEEHPGDSTERRASAPFPGYDRIGSSELVRKLADHSQVELEAADAYERAHENRLPVLDKLHYLRGPEPLPGYDALEVDQVLEAIAAADDATLKKTRGYERKFARRPEVLDAIAELQRERRAALPAAGGAFLPAAERSEGGLRHARSPPPEAVPDVSEPDGPPGEHLLELRRASGRRVRRRVSIVRCGFAAAFSLQASSHGGAFSSFVTTIADGPTGTEHKATSRHQADVHARDAGGRKRGRPSRKSNRHGRAAGARRRGGPAVLGNPSRLAGRPDLLRDADPASASASPSASTACSPTARSRRARRCASSGPCSGRWRSRGP